MARKTAAVLSTRSVYHAVRRPSKAPTTTARSILFTFPSNSTADVEDCQERALEALRELGAAEVVDEGVIQANFDDLPMQRQMNVEFVD